MARKDVANAIKTAVTDSGAAGTDVELGRRDAWPEANLPAALIAFDEEQIEILSKADATKRTKEHRATFFIDLTVQKTATNDAETELYDKEALIEAEIDDDPTLGGQAKDAFISNIVHDGTGEANLPTMNSLMTVSATYQTVEA